MKISVEGKEIKLDDRIITELDNFHKDSESIYNEGNEDHKSAFSIIEVKDIDDIIKTHELLGKLNIKVLSNKKKFLKEVEVKKGLIIKDSGGWRIQSHYLGWGMNTDDLEKCVNYITEKGITENTKDYTKDKIVSRIKELKDGKKLYDENEKSHKFLKGSYSEDGHNFWKNSELIISELEKFI